MAANTKYYLYNKKDNWHGLSFNLNISDSGIKPKDESGGKFFSFSNDSMKKNTTWHRMRLIFDEMNEFGFYVSFYASDSRGLAQIGDIDSFLKNEKIDFLEKEKALEPYFSEPIRNPFDIPLNTGIGRYFWFKIDFPIGGITEVNRIKLEFPLNSLASYLPEIYRDESSDFLIRFLAVFQNIFLSIDDKIHNISRIFDANCADGEFLYWLASWVGINDPFIWSEDKLRLLIPCSVDLYKKKGTREGLIQIIELFTERLPLAVIENYTLYSNRFSKKEMEVYERLYGNDIYSFTIIMDEEALPTRQLYTEVKRIVDTFKPAFTTVNIVTLRKNLLLGSYTYLGINTYLPHQSGLVLDEVSAMPFKALM